MLLDEVLTQHLIRDLSLSLLLDLCQLREELQEVRVLVSIEAFGLTIVEVAARLLVKLQEA